MKKKRRRSKAGVKKRRSGRRQRELALIFALVFGSGRAMLARQVPFFTPPAITDSASVARSVHAADVDGDGDFDVLSASYADDKIAWYENNSGDGSSWSLHTISTSADGAHSIVTSDVDGDGDLDAISASWNSAQIAWHENTAGDGSAWSFHTIPNSVSGAHSVFAADVDGDGDIDALSASINDDKVAWYENSGGDGSSWNPHTITTSADGAQSVFAADVDGDGDVDTLCASYYDNTIAWYRNDTIHRSAEFVDRPAISTTMDFVWAVFGADVDSDGDLDALSTATSASGANVAWFENAAGDGSVWSLHTISTSPARSLHAADVDGDGDMDALATVGMVTWYENTAGDGSSWSTHTISTFSDSARSVFAADVDRDGDLDVISAFREDDTIAWHENTLGDGSAWSLHTISTSADFAISVSAGDVDGDGDMDALSASAYDDKIAWYENTLGDGSVWNLNTISTSADFALSAFAEDVDGDGDIDVLSASMLDDKIAWYENRGGQFALPTTDLAPGFLLDSQEQDVLQIDAAHRGRSGDSDVELATLELLFEETTGDPLTDAEANALIQQLSIYLDSGSGSYEPISDTLVHSESSLTLTSGVQTLSFVDNDLNVQVSYGSPKTYFVVLELTANASSQTPNTFRVTHITESSSTGEDAAYDIPISLEYAADTTTGTIDTVLSSTSCNAPFDLNLSNATVDYTLTCEAGGTIRAGTSFVIVAPGNVTFRVGEGVELQGGFNVGTGGQFTVEIDTSLSQSSVTHPLPRLRDRN